MGSVTFRGLPGPRFGGGGPEGDHRYDRGSRPSACTKLVQMVVVPMVKISRVTINYLSFRNIFSNFMSSEKRFFDAKLITIPSLVKILLKKRKLRWIVQNLTIDFPAEKEKNITHI